MTISVTSIFCDYLGDSSFHEHILGSNTLIFRILILLPILANRHYVSETEGKVMMVGQTLWLVVPS
jgi:hypothetical protein